jgi:hypothetical protein
MAATRTVRKLIERSMRVATILGAGDPMDANDADDALLSLNQMLDAWQAERLFCYAVQEQTHPLVAGTGVYTIGPTGDIVVPVRPVRLEYAFTRDVNNQDYIIETIPYEVWSNFALKSLGNNYPTALYYQPSYPDGTINLWQFPISGLTLHLGIWTLLTEYATLDDIVALPPGYEDALVFSLAERLCPEYSKPVSRDLEKLAIKARANIQQNNLGDPRTVCEFTGVNFRAGMQPAWVFASGQF